MSQDTDTGGTDRQDRTGHATGRPVAPHPSGPHPVPPAPFGTGRPAAYPTGPYPTGPFPPGHPAGRYPNPYATGPFPPGIPQQGAPVWTPLDDAEDPRPPGNPAAASSAVLGVIALLVSLRPLAFGTMSLSWDTYVALALGVLAVVVGIAGARLPLRRPVAAAGMALGLAALLVVAVVPTF